MFLIKWLFRLVLLVAVVYGAVFLLNYFDQDLEPGAEAWLQVPPRVDFSDPDNGYAHMLGLFAEPGADPAQAGQAVIMACTAMEPDMDPAFLTDECASALTMGLEGEFPSWLFSTGATDYLQQCESSRETILTLADANFELLDRYRAMLGYGHVYADHDSQLLGLIFKSAESLAIHDLYVAQASLRAIDGDWRGALGDLAQDISFQRAARAEVRQFAPAQFSATALAKDCQALSQILRAYPESARDPRLDALLTPATAQELDFSWHQAQRLRAVADTLPVPPQSLRSSEVYPSFLDNDIAFPVIKPMYQEHATLNAVYASLRLEAILPHVPLNQWPAIQAEYDKSQEHELDWELPALVNPLGKLYLQELAPHGTFEETAAMTVTLLKAQPHLVSLQRAMILERVPPDQAQAWLLELPRWLRDPLGGAPVTYNADDMSLNLLEAKVYLELLGPPPGQDIRPLEAPPGPDQDSQGGAAPESGQDEEPPKPE